MSELKPCPFCGSEPHASYVVVSCRNEECIANAANDEPTIGLIEAWNTRPIEDALHARIAELEQDLSNKETEYTDLWDDALAFQARIAELEAAQRWIPVSERLPKVSGWYLTGLVYFLGSLYSSEVYFDAENIEPRWNNSTSDKIYCWLEGVPELPTPPEVQE